MSKRKSKPLGGQGGRRAPRTAAQYLATPPQQQASLQKTAHVLSTMRAESVSLHKAAQEQGVSPRTVLRHAGSAMRKSSSGRYKAAPRDTMLRLLVLPSPSGLPEIATRDSRVATMAAEYWNAVHTFLQTGDASDLARFRGRHILDAEGNRVPLLTDLDELERLGSAGVLSFESLYARVA